MAKVMLLLSKTLDMSLIKIRPLAQSCLAVTFTPEREVAGFMNPPTLSKGRLISNRPELTPKATKAFLSFHNLPCVSLLSRCVGLRVLAAANTRGSPGHDGTFADPASVERTRFRYWLPDASVDPEVVKADVKSIGSVGGGGMEFLSFEYGGHVGSMPSGADWATYNFGTPPFQNLFRAALEAHHGLSYQAQPRARHSRRCR